MQMIKDGAAHKIALI